MAVLHCFTEGMCSELYITSWFCHRGSIPEHAYVNHFQSRQSIHGTTSMSQAARPWPKRCCAVRHCLIGTDGNRVPGRLPLSAELPLLKGLLSVGLQKVDEK